MGAFTQVAIHQARIAAADILKEAHAPADYRAVPRVTSPFGSTPRSAPSA